MSFSNYAAQAILNSLFGRTSNFGALASAPDLHLAASTTAPAEDGTNITEPSTVGTAYARLDVSNTDFNDATLADPSLLDNSGTLSFAQATGAGWGTISHLALMDNSTVGGGNMIASIALNAAKAIASGDTLEVEAGDLDFTLD